MCICVLYRRHPPDPDPAKECEKSSVHDLSADLITEAASNDYPPGNEATNSIYIAALISKFETRVKDEGEVKKSETQ
jgi:hypothetical protein